MNHGRYEMGALACVLASLVGCGKLSEPPPDPVAVAKAAAPGRAHHGEASQSYGAAVDRLVGLRDTIREAFAANHDYQAHAPLHEVGHLLEQLPELAQKHSPFIDSATVTKDVAELLELFGKVDEKMHGAEGADYAAVAPQIDAGINRLQRSLSAADRPALSEVQHP